MSTITTEQQTAALKTVTEQLSEAINARKCHGCGCLHKTVEGLAGTKMGKTELASVLSQARSVFKPKEYDCLGCPVCYPAIAANAFSDAFPHQGRGLDLCLTEEPEERRGWPRLPGDYHVLRYKAPVAVCTLNSEGFAFRLRDDAPDGLSIVGTLHTENLGVERIIQNTLSNPNIRFLILCGEDTKQAVGHLPGQSLKSLFRNGIDEHGRILGAPGRRPILRNISKEEITAFLEQVELVPMIGEQHEGVICRQIEECTLRDLGPFQNAPTPNRVEVVEATKPRRLTLDEAGYFVVYPERRAHRLVVEHYTNAGVLDCVIEGETPGAIYYTMIERKLITRLDHAAYLGRELARAERALETGEPYVQDRACGEIGPNPLATSCSRSVKCETGDE